MDVDQYQMGRSKIFIKNPESVTIYEDRIYNATTRNCDISGWFFFGTRVSRGRSGAVYNSASSKEAKDRKRLTDTCERDCDKGSRKWILLSWSTHLRLIALVRARRYASAVLAPVVFCWNVWTDRPGLWHGRSLRPILHCVSRKFGYLLKSGYYPL